MVLISDITLSALKFVCGNNVHVCRLCFTIIQEQEISIDDSVSLERDYFKGVVTFEDIFHDLRIPMELMLPQVICMSCAGHAINSYLFQKLCQHSTEKWDHVLNRLNMGLSQADVIDPKINSLYLLFNKDDTIVMTSCKESATSKGAALATVKNILRSRNNYLKRKENKLSCQECDKKFKSKALLRKHMRLHNKLKFASFPCPQCGFVFLTKALLATHAERVHYPKTIKCPKCPKKFSTERLLLYHNKSYHMAVNCKICNKQFPSKKHLRVHAYRHEVPDCPRCFRSFNNKNTYKFHLTVCGRVQKISFFCDHCDKGYLRKNGLISHLKTDHGFGKVFHCKWCGKKFDAISKLNNHAVKHTKERKFQCKQCNGKFVTKNSLLYHTRLHTGERPYPCDLCDQSFLSSSRRMEHKRRKHFGPSAECHLCHTKLTTTYELRNHIRRHYNPQSKLYIPSANESKRSVDIEYQTG